MNKKKIYTSRHKGRKANKRTRWQNIIYLYNRLPTWVEVVFLVVIYFILILISISFWESNNIASEQGINVEKSPAMLITLIVVFGCTLSLLILRMVHSIRETYTIFGEEMVIKFLERDSKIREEIDDCSDKLKKLTLNRKLTNEEKQAEFNRNVRYYSEDIYNQQKCLGKMLPFKFDFIIYVLLLAIAFTMLNIAVSSSTLSVIEETKMPPHFLAQILHFLVINIDHIIHGTFKLESYGILGNIIIVAQVLITVGLIFFLVPALATAAERFSHTCENKEMIEENLRKYFASIYPDFSYTN